MKVIFVDTEGNTTKTVTVEKVASLSEIPTESATRRLEAADNGWGLNIVDVVGRGTPDIKVRVLPQDLSDSDICLTDPRRRI